MALDFGGFRAGMTLEQGAQYSVLGGLLALLVVQLIAKFFSKPAISAKDRCGRALLQARRAWRSAPPLRAICSRAPSPHGGPTRARAVLCARRMMHELIDRMRGPGGFDYVIVCCSNLSGERYWQQRLEETIALVTGHASKVLCVHEDWDGGAGNGLGTLYAIVKAIPLARAKHGVELLSELAAGRSVALYHTAGKGTRLAPLPAAENNNKPAVKLPELIDVGGEQRALTVLEAVIRQTSILGRRAAGRLAVFWGDQVFVPSTLAGVDSAPTHHADILAALGPMPSATQWQARALHQYGLIATDACGDALQLEKVGYSDAVTLLPKDVRTVGTSLGSFSVSSGLLCELLKVRAAALIRTRPTPLPPSPTPGLAPPPTPHFPDSPYPSPPDGGAYGAQLTGRSRPARARGAASLGAGVQAGARQARGPA